MPTERSVSFQDTRAAHGKQNSECTNQAPRLKTEEGGDFHRRIQDKAEDGGGSIDAADELANALMQMDKYEGEHQVREILRTMDQKEGAGNVQIREMLNMFQDQPPTKMVTRDELEGNELNVAVSGGRLCSHSLMRCWNPGTQV